MKLITLSTLSTNKMLRIILTDSRRCLINSCVVNLMVTVLWIYTMPLLLHSWMTGFPLLPRPVITGLRTPGSIMNVDAQSCHCVHVNEQLGKRNTYLSYGFGVMHVRNFPSQRFTMWQQQVVINSYQPFRKSFDEIMGCGRTAPTKF